MHEMRSGSEVFRHKGVKMVGVMNRPAGGANQRFPAVLFLHGFPGAEKNVDIQRALLSKGVASFSLHFQGAWGSEGFYRFTTLPEQARAGLRFLLKQSFVDPKRVGVFGFSMGGWAALQTAHHEPVLRCVAAVAPVGGQAQEGPQLRSFIARLRPALRVEHEKALYLDFVKGMRMKSAVEIVGGLKRPLLLVHGSHDQTVPAAVSEALYKAAKAPKRLVRAGGARHDFLDRRAWLTRLVSDWLTKNL